MTVPNSTSYDEIPYPSDAYQQSHPDRLETLAKLFGMAPADIRGCRVLELACADGSNLVPMACALPESRFVGIDLSRRQVEAGQEVVAALRLTNIELRHLDIRDLDEGFGMFDYVIAHGVYSWVPKEVQEQILSVCSQRLNENGVAYISYNTNPGWRMRGLLRDMMLYHSRKFDDPRQQVEQARALIRWLGGAVRAEGSPYGLLLKSELEQMQKWHDSYFRHDSLGEINEPVYFHQFIEQAELYGLQYLAEAEFPSMLASNFAGPVDQTLNRLGRDIIELEQYMDFVRNRLFRQTLLCRRGLRLNRALGPWSLHNFHVAASIRPVQATPAPPSSEAEEFQSASGLTVTTNEPIAKAAFRILAECWPQSLFFPELVASARARLQGAGAAATKKPAADEADHQALGAALLTCVSKGVCELHVHLGPFVCVPGKRPRACPLARLQAVRGSSVINRRHERVRLDDFDRHLAPLLDGNRDRNALAEALLALALADALTVNVEDKSVRDPAEIRKIMPSQLESNLLRFGRQALLVG